MSTNIHTMYKIKPQINFLPNIALPTCMYKMDNLFNSMTSVQNNEKVQDSSNLVEIEKHQKVVLESLENLKSRVLQLKEELGIDDNTSVVLEKYQDIVIKANPSSPPLSVWVFCEMLQHTMPICLTTYTHSSLIEVPEYLSKLKNVNSSDCSNVSLKVIWKGGNKDHEMMVNPLHQGIIEGEVNIARYISRLLLPKLITDPIAATHIDNWLEVAHSSIIHGNNKDRQAALKSINSHLGKNSHLVGSDVSLADIVVWSSLVQTKLHESLPANVAQWSKVLLNHHAFKGCKDIL